MLRRKQSLPGQMSTSVWLFAIVLLLFYATGCTAAKEDDVYCFAVDYNGTEHCTTAEEGAPIEVVTPTAVPTSQPVPATINTEASEPGYALITPLFGSTTYLIDKDGQAVHSWQLTHLSGGAAYLLDDGTLLQTGIIEESELFPEAVLTGGGGYLQLLNWEGDVVWEYAHITDTQLQHHDVEPLPNGNILFIVYERFLKDDAIAAGRSPDLFPEGRDEIWSEAVLEIDPATNEIVWEWHVWDHLIQNVDSTMPDYGEPADNPGRIDINYFVNFDENVGTHVEWLHANAIDYNEEKDQILFSPRQFNEFWIIDHSTTTEEAAGERGDLLYRWGNPEAFGVGERSDQSLYFPHDPNWTKSGTILVFNNGAYNVREYSSVIEVAPAVDAQGNYVMVANQPTNAEVVWRYTMDPAEKFFSFIMGSAQRLPNGNTLVVDSFNKNAFEVNPENEVVWRWYEPDRSYIFRADLYSASSPPLAANGLD